MASFPSSGYPSPEAIWQARPSAVGGAEAGANSIAIMQRLSKELSDASQRPSFKVVTWNVLAHGLDAPSDFPKAAPFCLDYWKFRLPFIIESLKTLDADIICLQELNHPEYLNVMLPEFSMVFVPKLDSPCMPAAAPDGVCMLVRRGRFDILDVQSVYYRPEASAAAVEAQAMRLDESKPLANQNGIVLRLRDTATGAAFVIATTHLKAKEGNERIRLCQIKQMLARIKQMSGGGEGQAALPVILCGDCNSEPSERAVFETVYTDSDIRFSSCFNSYTQMQQMGRVVHHHDAPGYVPASSAAATSSKGPMNRQPFEIYISSEPSYTTWKVRQKKTGDFTEKQCTIDYLFANLAADVVPEGEGAAAHGPRKTLHLNNCMPLIGPSVTNFPGSLGLPSPAFPSDHLFLLAEFSFDG